MGLLSCLFFAKLFTPSPQSDQLLIIQSVLGWQKNISEALKCGNVPGFLSCLSTLAPRRNGERAPGAGDLAWDLSYTSKLWQCLVLRALRAEGNWDTVWKKKWLGWNSGSTTDTHLSVQRSWPLLSPWKTLALLNPSWRLCCQSRNQKSSSFTSCRSVLALMTLKLPWLYISRIRPGAWYSIKY